MQNLHHAGTAGRHPRTYDSVETVWVRGSLVAGI
jgi:hypothetical protein